VLGQPTGPGGGRWWTEGFDDTVGHRPALLLRRRRGVRGGVFRRFVPERIGRRGSREAPGTCAVTPWPPGGQTVSNVPTRRNIAARKPSPFRPPLRVQVPPFALS
jgi:hypothetical protein